MLTELLARNARHVAGLPEDHFDPVAKGQAPPVVSVCCSDSRVSAEGMWSADTPGFLFLSETIGNQVWDEVDGELVLDGNLAFPVHALGTGTVAVVGHTGCGAVNAALQAVQEGTWPESPGLRRRVELLAPVVEAGLENLEPQEDPGQLLDQLVELNVHAQLNFLAASPEVPEEVEVHGFVYDLHGSYGGPRGRAYLVNSGGERDLDELRTLVPPEHAEHVGSLLTS